eukprot:jgi/Botrbrau1/6275/Bobra.0129s0020.1
MAERMLTSRLPMRSTWPFHSVELTGPDIFTCQALGKKVILSMGGAAGVYGFRSSAAAVRTATDVWNTYLGGSGTNRPLGPAVLDGIDLDLEGGGVLYYPDFVQALYVPLPRLLHHPGSAGQRQPLRLCSGPVLQQLLRRLTSSYCGVLQRRVVNAGRAEGLQVGGDTSCFNNCSFKWIPGLHDSCKHPHRAQQFALPGGLRVLVGRVRRHQRHQRPNMEPTRIHARLGPARNIEFGLTTDLPPHVCTAH